MYPAFPRKRDLNALKSAVMKNVFVRKQNALLTPMLGWQQAKIEAT